MEKVSILDLSAVLMEVTIDSETLRELREFIEKNPTFSKVFKDSLGNIQQLISIVERDIITKNSLAKEWREREGFV